VSCTRTFRRSSSPIPTCSPKPAPAGTPASSRGSGRAPGAQPPHTSPPRPATYARQSSRARDTQHHATTQGVESFIPYQPWKTLTLRIDYTYTEATDDATQEELLRRPKNKGSFDAAWQITPVWLTTFDVLTVGTWVDGNRDFSVPRLDAPTYTTVDLATTYELTQRLALIARIDNLLDRLPEPGGISAAGLQHLGRQGDPVTRARTAPPGAQAWRGCTLGVAMSDATHEHPHPAPADRG
jgi:hypothetical protein